MSSWSSQGHWSSPLLPDMDYWFTAGSLLVHLFCFSGLATSCPCRFGSVACGIGQELYVFGGVRSQEDRNPERRQMMTCKSEFYHEEMRRWALIGPL